SCGERAPMQVALDRVRAGEEDPPCRSCGGILESATISFGQDLDSVVLGGARDAVESCDLLFAVGASPAGYPAAGPGPPANAVGAAVIIVNAEPTPYDDLADVVITDPISQVLPAICRGG